jgi:hypothetical protein
VSLVFVLAVAVNPVVSLVGAAFVVAVGVLGVYSYRNGFRAHAEAAENSTR